MNKKLTTLEQLNEQNKILNEIKQQNVENVKENELVRQQNEIIRTQNEISRLQSEEERNKNLDKKINSINEQLDNKVNKNEIKKACLAAVCSMGLCGELAFERLSPRDGNLAYRGMIIDEIFNLSSDTLNKGAKYESR